MKFRLSDANIGAGLSLSGDLCLPSGQIVGLLGANGVGKTTLLRHLSKIDRGSNLIAQSYVCEGTYSGASLVFQRDNLFPWMSVRENMLLGLEAANADRAEQSIQNWLDEFRMREVLDRWPSYLSGGERAIAALVRSLVNPVGNLLFLDEAFRALDIPNLTRALDLVKVEHTKVFEGILLVTHDPLIYWELCGSFCVLSRNEANLTLRQIEVSRENGIKAFKFELASAMRGT
ncbi:ATP-binding cassette domain-containing protein [Altererythrobacter luteolus]|uniref:ATP-binding cassette domain-containing protein n=1 Tax=Pontixanthobacter luteolus TaxID=295089 RepID=A0A6I4V2D8_9SPHN|nr:ATP-binding cassette domain-containing protein [Pontixanthobacter luteolus]MXP47431.1 ATP-binding cassette domain-containing protein [Pontixanthobacter luteolus]